MVKLTVFGKIVTAAAVLMLLYAVYYAYATATQDFAIGDQRILAGEGALDLWFTPNRQLAAVTPAKNGSLRLRKWDLSAGVEPKFSLDIDEDDVGMLASGDPATRKGQAVYDLSPEADVLAWVAAGKINARYTNTPGKFAACSLGRTFNVAYIRLLNSNEAVVVYEDGKLELWNLRKGEREEAGTRLDGGAWPMWANGEILAVALFPMGDVGTITFDEKRRIKFNLARVPFFNGVSLAVARFDRVAVGTGDGRVILINPLLLGGDARPTQLGSGSSSVRAVAFYADDVVLAAGDLNGIYSAKNGKASLELKVAASVHRMAVIQDQFAFSTANSIETAKPGFTYHPNTDQQFYISVFLSVFLAILGVIPQLVAFVKSRMLGSGAGPKAGPA